MEEYVNKDDECIEIEDWLGWEEEVAGGRMVETVLLVSRSHTQMLSIV